MQGCTVTNLVNRERERADDKVGALLALRLSIFRSRNVATSGSKSNFSLFAGKGTQQVKMVFRLKDFVI
jgi:hypothetical protein